MRLYDILGNGECVETNLFDVAHDLTIIENPTPGFVLDSVVCEGIFQDSITITEISGGIVAECNAPDEATCTFINVPGETATNIPTLSQWGMIAAAGGLGLVGVFFAVRKRRAAISN